MNRLTTEQEQFYKDKFLGKKVRYESWVGVCQFIGYNINLPSWGFQLTVDRTPIQNVNPTGIVLVD